MIAVPAPVLFDKIKLLKKALLPVAEVDIVTLGTSKLVKYPELPVIPVVTVKLEEINEVVVALIIFEVVALNAVKEPELQVKSSSTSKLLTV